MADTLTKKRRSELMAKVRGKNTKPEIFVRKFLFSKGFRYRVNDSRYPGSPDIILPKYKTAIFVNGCFWHGHQGCSASQLPKSNIEYWEKKIKENLNRDKKKIEILSNEGWKVITVW